MNIISSPRQSQRGMAVIAIMTILALMTLYVAANIRSLRTLEREVKLLDQKQIRRLERISETNRVAIVTAFSTVAASH